MMRRTSFTLLIIAVMALCLLLSTTAAAAIPTYNWYQTGGPVSGYRVRSIVNNPTNGVVYAACFSMSPKAPKGDGYGAGESGAGVWKYQNGTWSDTGQLSNYSVSGLTMDIHSGILYAAAGNNGVWKYDGATWTDTNPSMPTSADQVICDPNTGVVYAGMTGSPDSGVRKYEKGGWSDISGALAGYQVEGRPRRSSCRPAETHHVVHAAVGEHAQ